MAITLSTVQRDMEQRLEEQRSRMLRQMIDHAGVDAQMYNMQAAKIQPRSSARVRLEEQVKWAIGEIDQCIKRTSSTYCLTDVEVKAKQDAANRRLNDVLAQGHLQHWDDTQTMEAIQRCFREITEDKTLLPTFDPNKIGSLSMELSALKDLWGCVFGRTWVQPSAMPANAGQNPAFWKYGHARLLQHNMFEQYEDWVRLKEDL